MRSCRSTFIQIDAVGTALTIKDNNALTTIRGLSGLERDQRGRGVCFRILQVVQFHR